MINIQKGSMIVYRVFDIAEEVNLSLVEEMLQSEMMRGRLKFTRSPRQQMIIRNAPVTLFLGEHSILSGKDPFLSEVQAKIWDYGVISIRFQIPIPPGTSIEQLTLLSASIESDLSLDDFARVKANELKLLLGKALRDPHEWKEFEDYVIHFIEKVNGIEKAEDLLKHEGLPKLILSEPTVSLAERSKKSVLEGTFQYSEQDLTIIDWNSAIVVEPSGSLEVPEVIEFALTHLMEMRYYDALIDSRLQIIYDSIEESRTKFFNNRFNHLSREASSRYIEFSEFIERVDNSFKVVGDFYLARIFRAAGEKFRMHEWEGNITRKLRLFADLSELLQGEVNVNRSLWLEVTIVVLILFEIVSAMLKLGMNHGST